MTREGPRLVFDFRDCAPQALDGSPVNTTRAVAVSAVVYGLRLLLPEGTPTNAGILDGVEVLTWPGTVVDATYPVPVAAGNVETSQRLVDVILGAFGETLRRGPGGERGDHEQPSFGGSRPRAGPSRTTRPTAGGRRGPVEAGAHAVQTHMTNTRNTPVEALENELPVRVLSQTVRRGTGARGARAARPSPALPTDVRLSWMGERQRRAPFGAAGGAPGTMGEAYVRRVGVDEDERLRPRPRRTSTRARGGAPHPRRRRPRRPAGE